MKSELVQKLRTWKGKALTHVVLNEAADEIERLRRREVELLRQVETMRAELNKAYAIHDVLLERIREKELDG